MPAYLLKCRGNGNVDSWFKEEKAVCIQSGEARAHEGSRHTPLSFLSVAAAFMLTACLSSFALPATCFASSNPDYEMSAEDSFNEGLFPEDTLPEKEWDPHVLQQLKVQIGPGVIAYESQAVQDAQKAIQEDREAERELLEAQAKAAEEMEIASNTRTAQRASLSAAALCAVFGAAFVYAGRARSGK